MGRRHSYKTQDYSDRIMIFLLETGIEEITTEHIMRNVTGTDFRKVEGLVLLLAQQKLRPLIGDRKIIWTIKDV